MRLISFNPAMLAAVLAGYKTVTRRRLPVALPVQQEPGRYRYRELAAAGALFEDLRHNRTLLPPVACPFGQPGELLRVQEDPASLLTIKSIRAEQVRCLTDAEALAEGIRPREKAGRVQWGGVEPDLDNPDDFCWYNSPTVAFQALLASIYPTAWARNEWMWVIEFERVPDEEVLGA